MPADSTGTQVKTATGESAPAKNEPEAECQLPAAPTEPASDATELPSVPNHSDDSTGTPDGVPDELGTATADSTGPVGDQPDPTGTEESEAGDRDSKPDEEIVQASRGTKRMILVALFEKSSWTYVDRISSPEIAKWTEGKTGEVKDQTIRVHTPWLKDHDFIDGSIEGGNSGFWLLPKGKKLARKLAKT
ncbi:MAG: hypothetical protein HQ518_33195 [Rhodopirellula sp.]|nr:hypothetical protein [Rhodopirellula sp.]